MITRIVGAALILGSLTMGTGMGTAASASPVPSDPVPNPFANLACDCSAPDSAGRPAPTDELQRGLSTGLANHRARTSLGGTSQ